MAKSYVSTNEIITMALCFMKARKYKYLPLESLIVTLENGSITTTAGSSETSVTANDSVSSTTPSLEMLMGMHI